jgi:hypothetical protein
VLDEGIWLQNDDNWWNHTWKTILLGEQFLILRFISVWIH